MGNNTKNRPSTKLEAQGSKPRVERAPEGKRKERLLCFHTAIVKPSTLVTEKFYWSMMTHSCQQLLLVKCEMNLRFTCSSGKERRMFSPFCRHVLVKSSIYQIYLVAKSVMDSVAPAVIVVVPLPSIAEEQVRNNEFDLKVGCW